MGNRLQWGKRWEPGQIYGPDYCCPTCDWRPGYGKTFGQYTVGVDSEGPKSKQGDVMIGVQIIECPKDFTFFGYIQPAAASRAR